MNPKVQELQGTRTDTTIVEGNSDTKILVARLTVFSLATCGIIAACRSVRAFKKFINPKDIPHEFFRKNVPIYGKLLRIELESAPLLSVDHQPLVGRFFRKTGPGLPVKLEGIDLSGNGISWLQTIGVGKKIQVTLMSPHETYVSGIVYLENRNVAPYLVSLGFGTVAAFDHNLEENLLYKKYYKTLLQAEGKAEKKGLGMWTRQIPFLQRMVSLLLESVSAKLFRRTV